MNGNVKLTGDEDNGDAADEADETTNETKDQSKKESEAEPKSEHDEQLSKCEGAEKKSESQHTSEDSQSKNDGENKDPIISKESEVTVIFTNDEEDSKVQVNTSTTSEICEQLETAQNVEQTELTEDETKDNNSPLIEESVLLIEEPIDHADVGKADEKHTKVESKETEVKEQTVLKISETENNSNEFTSEDIEEQPDEANDETEQLSTLPETSNEEDKLETENTKTSLSGKEEKEVDKEVSDENKEETVQETIDLKQAAKLNGCENSAQLTAEPQEENVQTEATDATVSTNEQFEEKTEETNDTSEKEQVEEESNFQMIQRSLENQRNSISNASEQEIPPTSPRSDVTFSPENEGAFTTEITSECSKIINEFSADIEGDKTETSSQVTDELTDIHLDKPSEEESKSDNDEDNKSESSHLLVSTSAGETKVHQETVNGSENHSISFSEKSSPVVETDTDLEEPSFTTVMKEEVQESQEDVDVDDESYVVVSLSDVKMSQSEEEKFVEETKDYEPSSSTHTDTKTEAADLESVIDICSTQFQLLDLAESKTATCESEVSSSVLEESNSSVVVESVSALSNIATAASSSKTKTTTTVVTKIEKLDAEGNIIESSTIVRTTDSESQDSESVGAEQDKATADKVAGWGKPLGLPSPANPALHASANRTPSNVRNGGDKHQKSRERIGRGDRKISPVYLDLAYVPHHGDANYSDVEFFKKVRARYYVFSGVEPSKEVLNALLEAKMTWENKDLGEFI